MRHTRFHRCCATALAIVALAWAQAAAAIPFLDSSGLSAPDVLVTFDEIGMAPDTPVDGQYGSLGVTFSPALGYDSQGSGVTLPGISGHYLGNNSNLAAVNPFSIRFNFPVTAAVFGLATNPSITTFTALLDGVEVESFIAATTFNEPEAYLGFVGILFDEILVSVDGLGGAALIDNVQYEFERVDTVSEPPAAAMLAIGIAAMVLRRKK